MFLGCASKASVKVRNSSVKKSEKMGDQCAICSNPKNILTLTCKHKLCVKCYNNTRLCTICEKAKSKFRWCWCC